MKTTKRNTRNKSEKAKQLMKTTGKVLGVAAAISLLLITHNTEYRAIAIEFTATDASVTPSERTHSYAAEAAAEMSDGQLKFAVRTADNLSQVPAADSNLVLAQREDQMGPPNSGDPVDDKPKSQEKRAPRDKMSGPVAALAAVGSGMAEIVVRYDQHPEFFDDERVAELGGEVTRSYEHLDMRAITLPAASLEKLAVDDNIDWLSIDSDMSLTSVASRVASNIPAAGSVNAGYNGTDVGIAVLDTGVSLHGDLSGDIVQYSFLNGAYPIPEIVNGELVAPGEESREDLFGHGTHVAGVLTGSGNGSEGNFKGTSTGAKVLSLQVLDGNGGGSMSDVMAALDWLLTYGSYFDIRVVNLSLGKGISESNETDPLVIAVENLWDAGMVVVVAAGNDGHQGSMTVTSPGNSRKVITVGSLTDNGTGTNHLDDYVSSFSSAGPTIGDYVLKPDLLAPGNRVVATIPTGSLLAVALAGRIKACVVAPCAGEYLEMSGTSMATPVVSAAAALMLDKDPSLTPATVKARLMRSAMKLDADPTSTLR